MDGDNSCIVPSQLAAVANLLAGQWKVDTCTGQCQVCTQSPMPAGLARALVVLQGRDSQESGIISFRTQVSLVGRLPWRPQNRLHTDSSWAKATAHFRSPSERQ